MALWTFIEEGGDVVVIRRDARGACERGRGEARFLPDLVATVLCRSGAWERVATPHGTFTKQVGPRGWV